MFYKVAINTESVNMEALLLGKYRAGFCEPLGTFFVNQSIHILALCIFLLKDTSFKIQC